MTGSGAPTTRQSEADQATVWQTLAERAPAPLALLDPSGRLTWCNRAWLDERKCEFSDEQGEGWVRSVHPEDAKRVALERADALDAREPYSLTYRRHAEAGKIQTITEVADPVRSEHGSLLAWTIHLVRARDVPPPLFARFPLLAWQTDADRPQENIRITHLGEPLASTLGVDENEWRRDPHAAWFRIVHPQDASRIDLDCKNKFLNEDLCQGEIRLLAADGRVLSALSTVLVQRGSDGLPRTFYGIAIDASLAPPDDSGLGEHRQVATTLLTTLSDLGFGIVVTDSHRFHYVNEAFCRLCGFSAPELAALAPLTLVLGEQRLTFRDWVRERRDPRTVETTDITVVQKDGERLQVEATVMPLAEAGPNGPRLWVSILRNVTAERMADMELETARRQVAQAEKLSVLGSLVSGVAHEIRTPLAYLDNHISLIEARVSRALQLEMVPREMLADLPGHAAAAHEGVDRINRLVKDLRRFMKMETNHRAPVRLDTVVEEALRLFRAANSDGISIDAHLEPVTPVPLDPAQIQQIVINLLDNAADASRGLKSPIRIRTNGAVGGVELVVEDDGIGIPEDVRTRIFDPFFSTKPDGTGLGLAIVRRIVETHGGQIACESSVGRGTRFRVFIPAMK